MKITPDNILKINRDVTKKQPETKSTVASNSTSKPFAQDKITIESNQGLTLSDVEFVTQLKKNILAEIKAGAPEHKLIDLKQQIALNEYDVNVPEVVRKIMLDSHEVSHG